MQNRGPAGDLTICTVPTANYVTSCTCVNYSPSLSLSLSLSVFVSESLSRLSSAQRRIVTLDSWFDYGEIRLSEKIIPHISTTGRGIQQVRRTRLITISSLRYVISFRIGIRCRNYNHRDLNYFSQSCLKLIIEVYYPRSILLFLSINLKMNFKFIWSLESFEISTLVNFDEFSEGR